MARVIDLIYQTLSNLLNPSKLCVCRFVPSCSQYASQAVKSHGILSGTILIFRRLIKCHPWGPYGLDPVPSPEKSNS